VEWPVLLFTVCHDDSYYNAEQPITALLIIIPNAFQNVNLAPAKTGRGRRSFGILRQREIEDLHSRRQGLRR
jgi:hypothetical protein